MRFMYCRHMGPLKSMKYGSLLKAIYKFTMVRQNYGEFPAIALISSSEVCMSCLHNDWYIL